VSFEDAKNKERIINIMKSLLDSDKIKPYVKEFVEASYKQMVGMGVLSVAEKNHRSEEEKKMFDHEKDISSKDGIGVYKDMKKTPNGIKVGYDKRGYTGVRSAQMDCKPGIPKTASNSKLKRSLKKKKKEPSKMGKAKAKAK
jgi:hypothetical protein